jgi:hypothetical protein
MENVTPIADTFSAPPLLVEVSALTRLRLDELDRLRELGFAKTADLRTARDGLSQSPLLSPEQQFRHQIRYVDQFDRIGRAIRQIITLEFELLGLFEAPDRDAFPRLRLIKPEVRGALRPGIDPIKPITLPPAKDFGVRPDYSHAPMEDVVAGIRKTLGAEPPPNDPFAPPPERKARAAAPTSNAPPAKLPPATVKLPTKPQVNRAFETAVLALSAKLGSGSRISPTQPRHPLAMPAHARKSSHNRGPPK